MTETDWWATAPAWANYHTWDGKGKAWWEMQPAYNYDYRRWEIASGMFAKYRCYDIASLPIELAIDPAATLRKRPKLVSA